MASSRITMSTGFNVPSLAIFKAYTATNYLQNVDYRYNIRGQVLSINNSKLSNDGGVTNTDTNDLFGMLFLYDQPDGNLNNGAGNNPSYDGKLSAVKWMTKDAHGNSSYERSYTYSYDGVNRYTGETYSERTPASTGNFSNNVHGFDENNITYDAGGNILTLQRNSSTQGTNSNVQIDNLTYSYNTATPNQLLKVADATGNAAGFNPGTGAGNYAYDPNGNLTTDPYKGLAFDQYNVLNRPDKITVTAGTGQYINYTYNASGNLIRKQEYNNNLLGTTTDYIDGFVYLTQAAGAATLSYFPMPEGRVINNSGTLKQEFIITDGQGNARISFQNNGSGMAVVTQETSYYGFGLQLLNSPVSLPPVPNKQLYNGGSEWQNDYSNLPDYYQTFYRNYDAAIGRFVGVDPQAESAESMTGYQYAGNMPTMLNDPDGSKPVPASYNYNYNYVSPLSPNAGPMDNSWQDSGNFFDLGQLGGGTGGVYAVNPGLAWSLGLAEGMDMTPLGTSRINAVTALAIAPVVLSVMNQMGNGSTGVNIYISNTGDVSSMPQKTPGISLSTQNSNDLWSWRPLSQGGDQEGASIKILVADASGMMDVGHTAIQLNSNYVFGYYPSSSDGHGYGSGDLMSSKGAPTVESRSKFNSQYSAQGYTEYTLSVTSQQLSSLQSYLSNVMANPGNYNLFLNNCTSVIISGLENAGVPLRTPLGDPISPALTSPAVFGSELSHPIYMPGIVTGMQHYGGN